MVCNRCVTVVGGVFNESELNVQSIAMGVVDIKESYISDSKRDTLAKQLNSYGFELIDDKKTKLVESLKKLIVDKINNEDLSGSNLLWSQFISENLHFDYKYISSLFSSIQGITIERYIILQKVEKVKEILICKQLSLSEIAWRLKYSSVAHLSNQFKEVTGMPPKKFKRMHYLIRSL